MAISIFSHISVVISIIFINIWRIRCREQKYKRTACGQMWGCRQVELGLDATFEGMQLIGE
jgi:hypothetical protein